MKTKHFFISILSLTLIGLAIPSLANAQYSLYVGESEFISTPDPPYDGWLENAHWTRGSHIAISEQSTYGAIICPSHYFEGRETVTCTYTFGYYVGTTKRAGQLQKTFYITCNEVTGKLSEEELNMAIGQKMKLTYYPDYSGYTTYTNKYVTWESSNEDVATVDANGNVKAVSSGRAVITFDPVGGPLLLCNVIVHNNTPTSISLPATANTKVDEYVMLTPTLTPSDAYTIITWKSSDETVATVSDGKVYGKKPGTAIITATTDNGLSASCYVTVNKGSVTITADTESGIYASGKTIALIADPTDADIYYTLDGSTPSTSSMRYTEPITLTKSVTLKAIATGGSYETSNVLIRSYQITTLCVKSHWDEAEELPPLFVPSITFSQAIYKSNGINGIRLQKDNTPISGQPIVQNGILYFIPDSKLDDGTYMLVIPENAVKDANEEPNLFVQMNFKIGKSKVKQAAGGSYHSLFAKTDGTLWAFGKNEYGQLGDGTTTDRTTPVKMKIMDDAALISAGNFYSIIVKDNRTLWGCGDLSQYKSTSPVMITNGVASASANSHYLFVKNDGTLWACGYNSRGQLGDGTTTYRLSPVKITTGVASVSAGEYHSLIIKNDGSLWACGENNIYGQLGDGTKRDRTTPVKIMDDVASVSAGGNHSLIIKNDGSLWACGDNSRGQLGDGTTTIRTTPVKIMDDVASVSAGYAHSLIIKNDGSLWACGHNHYGQLGDGTTAHQKTPVKIMDGVASVSAGSFHSLIIKNDGSLWACGDNYYGQLGDGTTTNSSTPVCILATTPFSQVEEISLPQANLQIEHGSQYLLLPTMMPENSTCESIVFESNNPQVATISSRGMVTGIAPGDATLTVKVISEEGLELIAQCIVTVIENILNGDVNGDGFITIADVTSLVNIILGKQNNYDNSVADVNGDGNVTIADVTSLVNIILGKNKDL